MPDFHDRFSVAADELAEKAIESLKEALDSKKKYRVSCPKCKASFAAPFPDFNARAKAIEMLRDSGKGKPATQKPVFEEPKARVKKLEDYTDEELDALIQDLEQGLEGESGKAKRGGKEEASG